MSTPGSNASLQRRGSFRAPSSVKSSGIPRTNQRNTSSRTVSQPSYDFLTGSTSIPQPGANKSSTNGNLGRQEPGLLEKLRAEVKALKYELATLKSDREVNDLRRQSELSDAQRLAEEEGSKAVALASEARGASQKQEKISKELRDAQLAFANEKQDLEQKLRRSQDRNRSLEEEVEDGRTELSSMERQWNHKCSELVEREKSLQQTCEGLQLQVSQYAATTEDLQAQIDARSSQIGNLEGEIITLKTGAGDQGALDLIRHELSEQVNHIRSLESANREQLAEIKHYRETNKGLEIVEEEKRALQVKVQMMEDLRKELSESKLQRQILEDEKNAWASYLANESSFDAELQFSTPEELARALVSERIEKIGLLEKVGGFEPELLEKDSIIQSLEVELSKVKAGEARKASSKSTESESRKVARLERQRVLAVKEVEYLRAQLKTFDSEETTFQTSSFDEQKAKRIADLEALVDQYRKELETTAKEASSLGGPSSSELAGTKRPLEDESDERLGQLSRKNRKLQDEVLKLRKTNKVLENDLTTQKSLIKSQTASSRIRVLELRSNPTAEAAAIKSSTLKALKAENEALLAKLEGSSVPSVPVQTLESSRRDLSDMEKMVAEKEKRMTRLKQIWSSKSLEFREAVASVLGWKMDFMPNGRVRVTSMFHHSADDDGPSEENSIIFDGENGTMKISGGPNSKFALEIKEQIKFWVEQRKEIPCFLAACTLEFYEKTTRALRI